MSPVVLSASGPPASRNCSALRAIRDRRASRPANARAHAAPIPCEAPVMTTTLSLICIYSGDEYRWTPRRIQNTAAKRNNSIMQSTLLPLFPLRVVVFPRTPLPLHVFEDRYKEMVGEAISAR